MRRYGATTETMRPCRKGAGSAHLRFPVTIRTYHDRMNPILPALLCHPHLRDIRIFLQVQYLVAEWCHCCFRPNRIPRLHGVPKLVELVGWDEAGVAACLPNSQNGHRLSEVLADHI